jgi:hypothetical protein
MTCAAFRSLRRLFLPFLSIACIVLGSHAAFAAPPGAVAGCDPRVADAMAKEAQAKVAKNVAETAAIMGDKPPSTLVLSCQDQIAAAMALDPDNFSGDINNGAVFDPTFANMTGQAPDTSGSGVNCNRMETFYDATIGAPPKQDIPTLTDAELLSGTFPAGADPNYLNSMNAAAAANVFTDAKTAEDLVPKPIVPDFSTASSQGSCAVLVANGTLPPGTQCP